ncbi:MAG: response regulator [Massilia sp.]
MAHHFHSTQEHSATEHASQHAGQASVVLVDDDPDLRQALLHELTAAGHKALGFASAEDFLAAEPAHIACLVLDVDLAGMSGIALYRALCQRDGAAVPVVFIAAGENAAHAREAGALGAVDFLARPFDAGALIAAVDAVAAPGRDA